VNRDDSWLDRMVYEQDEGEWGMDTGRHREFSCPPVPPSVHGLRSVRRTGSGGRYAWQAVCECGACAYGYTEERARDRLEGHLEREFGAAG